MYPNGASVSPVEQRRILDAVLGRARAVAARGVVAFDLDSTLLDNRPRQARILAEYGRDHGLAALAAIRPEHWQSWDIALAMRASGLDAAAVAEHAAAAKAYWRERFFTSAYCVDDLAIAGATAYLAELAATQVKIAYVTGRHSGMGDGTRASLGALGFPIPDGDAVHLLLKPTFEMGDDAWKREAFQRLEHLGEVVAAFDNEPTHINDYVAFFPRALAVHLATDQSGRDVTVADGIVAIRDFTRP